MFNDRIHTLFYSFSLMHAVVVMDDVFMNMALFFLNIFFIALFVKWCFMDRC